MMVHDRYCFQVGEGILPNVFPAENFKELYQENIQTRSINISPIVHLFLFISATSDWICCLIQIEVYFHSNCFQTVLNKICTYITVSINVRTLEMCLSCLK